jgi:thioredoxin reductase
LAEDGFLRPLHARAVVLATGARRGEPQLALAQALGCLTRFDLDVGYERLVLDAAGETSVPGVFAAGDVARVRSEEEAIVSGRRAGELAAALAGNRS